MEDRRQEEEAEGEEVGLKSQILVERFVELEGRQQASGEVCFGEQFLAKAEEWVMMRVFD